MKILHTVKSYSPLSGGMYEVVRQISKYLSQKGHSVTIASMRIPDGLRENQWNIQIVEFDLSKKGGDKEYQEYLIGSDFDIVTNFAAQQPMTDLVLPILGKIRAKKVFVPTGFNAIFSRTHKEYFERMKKWMKEYDLNIFLSNSYQDIDFARRNGVSEAQIAIIPNGASSEEFFRNNSVRVRDQLGINENDFLVLHVGSFTGVKGHYEAIEIFSKAKIDNSTLLLIGNGDTECSKKVREMSNKLNNSVVFMSQNKKIIIPDFSREETVSAYQGADVFLFPSNTECSPIVLFEAMAAALPFLATDVGNVREIIQWSNGGVLLPTKHNVFLGRGLFDKIKKMTKRHLIRLGVNLWNPDIHYAKADIDGSVKVLEEMYSDPGKRARLGENGRNSWLKNFTWEKIAGEYEKVYRKLLMP